MFVLDRDRFLTFLLLQVLGVLLQPQLRLHLHLRLVQDVLRQETRQQGQRALSARVGEGHAAAADQCRYLINLLIVDSVQVQLAALHLLICAKVKNRRKP